MMRFNPHWLTVALAALLCATTLAIFSPATRHKFIELDDPEYVSANAIVQRGLTWEGIAWAWQPGHAGNWHPATWWSHMLDVELLGLDAGRHHAVNVLLHALNTSLLFLVLCRMTRAVGKSAFVAAFFAWHPLHVESVAWVAERKDLLSGAFFMLTLGAYALYAESDRAGSGPVNRRRGWYAVTVVLFALGLLCKPMLVTLPFVLLLLDAWPLRRLHADAGGPSRLTWRMLIVEKIPFLLLCLGSCALTLVAQTKGRAVATLDMLPLSERLANALSSYVRYLGRTFWPVDLAVFYPHPSHGYAAAERWSSWQLVAGAGLLISISVAGWLRFRREPWLGIGWCWFLGMLVPVIGVVQVGAQAMADRYTYLPLIGIFIACVWSVGEWGRGKRHFNSTLGTIGVVALGTCAVLTRQQLSHWRDDIALFTHARAVTSRNPKVEFSLGQAYLKAGALDLAVKHLQAALADDPGAAETHYALAQALTRQGRTLEAVDEFQKVLAIVPGHQNAGAALEQLLIESGVQAMQAGRTNDAAAIFEGARNLFPDVAGRNLRAGQALAERGQWDGAISNLSVAVWLNPQSPEAWPALGTALSRRGQLADSAVCFRRALELNPDQPAVAIQLAWILATAPAAELRDGNEALRLAQQANGGSQTKDPAQLLALSAAYAELGRFEEAISAATECRTLADRTGNGVLARQSAKLLACFQSGKPFRQIESDAAGEIPR